MTAAASLGEIRARRGRLSHVAGQAAEEIVAEHYAADGHEIMERRWRGLYGEIDIIAEDDEDIVFIEVKKAATHDAAALRLSRRQQERIMQSACDYVSRRPRGLMTPFRIDVALVDGRGEVRVLHNAVFEA
ncbi:YraN family protein [Pseudoroseicyclus sp. CXY001]|uniref:YraN family protein n=1 Tax=Pseudoroseicyclus sp. CXY001 TaxID=3242492 RepID=UPI0035714059